MTIEETTVGGLRCLRLARGPLAVSVTVDVGPRIIAFSDESGVSPFVLTPDLVIVTAGAGDFQMVGGHRLWHSPEVPVSTYLPDDEPVEVSTGVDGATFGVLERPTGIRKELRVSFVAEGVAVDHALRNESAGPVTHAAWAITMLTLGGEAWLPQSFLPLDSGGFIANRSIALWPYTRLTDPRLDLGERLLRVRGLPGLAGPVKIGTQVRPGWLAYRLGTQLFVKRAPHLPDAEYADLGTSAQCYAGDRFLELETLGPLVTLAPGESTEHRETWSLHTVDPNGDPEATVAALGLELA